MLTTSINLHLHCFLGGGREARVKLLIHEDVIWFPVVHMRLTTVWGSGWGLGRDCLWVFFFLFYLPKVLLSGQWQWRLYIVQKGLWRCRGNAGNSIAEPWNKCGNGQAVQCIAWVYSVRSYMCFEGSHVSSLHMHTWLSVLQCCTLIMLYHFPLGLPVWTRWLKILHLLVTDLLISF